MGVPVPAGGNNNAGAPFRTRFAFPRQLHLMGRPGLGGAQVVFWDGGRNTQCRSRPLSIGVRLSAPAFWIWFLGFGFEIYLEIVDWKFSGVDLVMGLNFHDPISK